MVRPVRPLYTNNRHFSTANVLSQVNVNNGRNLNVGHRLRSIQRSILRSFQSAPISFRLLAGFGIYVLMDLLLKNFIIPLLLSSKIPGVLLLWWIFISLSTYVVYSSDKDAARQSNWRTSEIHLHFYSLIGGWPGALLAMYRLPHKWKKVRFLVISAIMIYGNWYMVYRLEGIPFFGERGTWMKEMLLNVLGRKGF
ncbi:hypothetical protein Ddc_13863 [Ditylenchus destructor]|nr:hypothetical protein Ddc_13863 [Ditylenchus destructor]